MSFVDQECVQDENVKSLLLLPGAMPVDSLAVICPTGVPCTNENMLAIKLKMDIEPPAAYCLDDFQTIYEDEYILAMREGNAVAGTVLNLGTMDKIMIVPESRFALTVCI